MRRALPGEINYPPVDRFTLAHLAVGFLLGAVRLPPWAIVPVATGWEVAERPLKENFPGLFPHRTQDTFANAAVDALAMIGGYYIWRRMK